MTDGGKELVHLGVGDLDRRRCGHPACCFEQLVEGGGRSNAQAIRYRRRRLYDRPFQAVMLSARPPPQHAAGTNPVSHEVRHLNRVRDVR